MESGTRHNLWISVSCQQRAKSREAGEKSSGETDVASVSEESCAWPSAESSSLELHAWRSRCRS